MLGHQVCYSFPFYHEKKLIIETRCTTLLKTWQNAIFPFQKKTTHDADASDFFAQSFQLTLLTRWIWVKNSLHVRVSDKSSLIFQTWRREESFNEDYRQIAVVTSGRGWCRGGWSLIEHIVTPKGWVLIRDIQLSTDTTFNWENSLVISTEPMH